eukprot:13030961-Alexandrium_andersonii.AAC.1
MHEACMRNGSELPPPQIRQIGNNIEDIQRVLDHWKQSAGEPLIDFKGPCWGVELPTEDVIQSIRDHLSMPPLQDTQFAGLLYGEDADM